MWSAVRIPWVAVSNGLAAICGMLARFFEERERRLRRCYDCGRSRFYGKPCV